GCVACATVYQQVFQLATRLFSVVGAQRTVTITSELMIAAAISITSPGSEETVVTISATKMVRRLPVRTSRTASLIIPILADVTMMKTMATAANTATSTPTRRNMPMVIAPATNQHSDGADIEWLVTL